MHPENLHFRLPQCYWNDWEKFQEHTDNLSRTVGHLISQFNLLNIDLDIPTVKNALLKNPEKINMLRSLIDGMVEE